MVLNSASLARKTTAELAESPEEHVGRLAISVPSTESIPCTEYIPFLRVATHHRSPDRFMDLRIPTSRESD